MKILYLHQYFNTPEMAGGTRSYEMARRMVAAGHEVHVITSWRKDKEDKGWRHEAVEGIDVHWLPVRYENSMGFNRRIQAFLKFAILAGTKAKSIGGDVVFATSTPLTIALPGYYASRILGCPMVFEVRDLWPELPIAIGAIKNPILKALSRGLEKFAYHSSMQVVALSPGMAEGVARQGYPKERIHVIPNSCDNGLFQPNSSAAKQFRESHPELGDGIIVLYAGTFGQINGVEFLVELAAKLRDANPDTRFVAIGGGSEFNKVREKAIQLNVLGKNYFQYESMPKQELVGAVQAAEICASLFINLPEMQNNSANKFFDALAAGKAIAINYGGWHADLISAHLAGVNLGPGIEDASARLSALLNQKTEIRMMGKNARQLALQEFDRDKLAKELIGVLHLATSQK